MTESAAPPALDIVTFGCRLNALESENVRALAADAGVTDTVVVNTCAVTAEAVRQARQTIRRIRRERPNARIVATGCAAQTEPDTFAGMVEVDHVIGNAEKLAPAFWQGLPRQERMVVSDIMTLRDSAEHMVDAFDSRTRAFVEVQNGCDHRCTFCIIPYGRGPSRSVPMGAVVEQVKRLVASGHVEVVLTGVDLTSYGGDLPGNVRLGDLVARILRHVPDLKRLRISSIDSIEVDTTLLDVFASEARLMPHLHLSLQAGDDMVLKRMKRRHLREDAVRFCADVRARRPDVVFGADLIAGFPTETDAMFDNTLAAIDDCGLTHVHVFPFSPRKGTPAARMPQVARQTVKARAARLREAATRRLAATLAAAVGTTTEVLAEEEGRGRTPHYLPARLAGVPAAPGALVTGRVAAVDNGTLVVEGVAA
ncbi:tRNA (N(6)-L-threonylcarbamoyladenosine(37)-C(2))-methylthiotransferase MtaB [Acuticoccus mangrovi]|uniref:tRNA (N(6)-L-threonylcarbamoyladenosine(37)-C(2))- methylthiotransferase MtaB n=1 Tax=Acuticoccus mangrovi TaxID=2796142 RepID=UPI002FCAD0CD